MLQADDDISAGTALEGYQGVPTSGINSVAKLASKLRAQHEFKWIGMQKPSLYRLAPKYNNTYMLDSSSQL